MTSQPRVCTALVRGAVAVPEDAEPTMIADGAVCIDGDRIIAVGRYDELAARHSARLQYGSPDHLVLPGFVNAHDHVRAPGSKTLGVPDDMLEIWILDLLRLPDLDPRLVSTLAHGEMLEAGITTVVNSFYASSGERYDDMVEQALAGAAEAGARSVIALQTMDESIVAALLDDVRRDLPAKARATATSFLHARGTLDWSDYEAIVRKRVPRSTDRASFLAGPVSMHWCSEALLDRIWGLAAAMDVPVHTHLLESRYQRDESVRRFDGSIIEFMNEAGYLNDRLSCAHGVQLSEPDLRLLAASEVSVVHCPGSNMRLKNGIAPVPAMLGQGINVALGLDSMGVAGAPDMLAEMAYAAKLHRRPTEDALALSASHMLAMATKNGAKAIGLEGEIGSLAPGMKADIVTLRRTGGGERAADLGAIFANGGPSPRVDEVLVDGDLVVRGGRHVELDCAELRREALAAARHGQPPPELADMIAAAKPHLMRLLGADE